MFSLAGGSAQKPGRRLRGDTPQGAAHPSPTALSFCFVFPLMLLQVDALSTYLDAGGSLLVMVGEGGEAKAGTNLNALLKGRGVTVNDDVIVRTVYHKYLHPKEAYVSNGVLNKTFADALLRAGSKHGLDGKVTTANQEAALRAHSSFEYVIPYGCTLNVTKPAMTVLTTGNISYPVQRPYLAVSTGPATRAASGRLAVLGSVDMLGDDWLNKEKNSVLQDVLFRWLLKADGVTISPSGGNEGEVADYNYVPDTQALAEKLRPCLQEAEPLPADFTRLFDTKLFGFDTSVIPEVAKLYKQLQVKHEPLSLIRPQFETPLPPMQPAVFPPAMREPPPPALELFDLDDHFASERLRLAQLTNKCTDSDLDFYIREAAEIVGATESLPLDK